MDHFLNVLVHQLIPGQSGSPWELVMLLVFVAAAIFLVTRSSVTDL